VPVTTAKRSKASRSKALYTADELDWTGVVNVCFAEGAFATSGVTMGWLLRLVTGGRSTGGRGPPTVLEFLVINFSVCLVLVLRKWRGPRMVALRLCSQRPNWRLRSSSQTVRLEYTYIPRNRPTRIPNWRPVQFSLCAVKKARR